MSLKQLQRSRKQGFGLVELLVAISVMVLVLSVIIVEYNSFNGAVLLRSQAFEIALTAREAQTIAVSVQGDAGDFRDRFGMYIDTATGQDKKFVVFRDADDDGEFDNNATEGISVNYVDTRFEIRDITAEPSGTVIDDVAITFQRPNFDAEFFSSSGVPAGTDAIVIGVSPQGMTGTNIEEYRTVTITSAGQIEVN